MQRGNIADQRPVHLLREGGVFVPRPQARLDVAHRDLVIKRRQRPGKRRRRIAVDEDHIRLGLVDNVVHPQQGLRRDGREGLALFHDIQVIVAPEMEDLHNRVQHLAVLPGQAADALKAIPDWPAP